MNAEKSFSGRCLCGAVQIEVTPPTRWCYHCHCSLCRAAHGAPFVTWFGVRHEQLEVTRGADVLRWRPSSDHGWRAYCQECGTQMLFETSRYPEQIDVVRAVIAGDIDREPSAHIHVLSKVDWVNIDDGLDRYSEDSGSEKIYP
ncbi:MAG: GFA family protein [Gammaproteobacteria bacterium]|nr:GFA family protein [Gammaproteobacteria bacterium]